MVKRSGAMVMTACRRLSLGIATQRDKMHMRLAIKTFTVYLRIVVVLLVVGAIGLILFNNRSHTVSVWLFGLTDPSKPINVVWVILATSVCTLVAWWMVSLGRGLLRDFRELHRAQ